MRGDEYVIELMVLDQMISGIHQLRPNNNRERATNDSANNREEQVKGSDVLVVRRAEPADKEAGRMAMAVNIVAMQVGDIDTARKPLLAPSITCRRRTGNAGCVRSGCDVHRLAALVVTGVFFLRVL